LTGIRVLDLATVLGAPVAATLLGEFGAEVIKVEEPTTGDLLRQFGPRYEGRPLLWLQEARNKKSITLNLRLPRGQAILRQLAAGCDVLAENFRPGTLEQWGLGYESLAQENPGLILLRVSGYGQTGPYRHKGAFDRVASAFAGPGREYARCGGAIAAPHFPQNRTPPLAGAPQEHAGGADGEQDPRQHEGVVQRNHLSVPSARGRPRQSSRRG